MKSQQKQSPTSRIAQLEKELAATTRNLEIEAALERVRARAMAMQNSDELAGLVTTLFNELSKLHFTLARCLIWIIDAETLSATTWMANPGVEAASYQMQYFDHPYYKGIIKAWKERKTKWAYELKGEEKRALDDIVLNLPALKNTPEVVKAAMRAVDRAVISFSFANFGGLQVDGTEPLSEDNIDILSRFSKVFDQTHTRFSDLKKAEAQAREAKIEAALERVRSRTMAMQKSEELADVIQLIFEQFVYLGFNINNASFNIDYRADNDFRLWIASSYQRYPSMTFTPYLDHPVFNIPSAAKDSGSDHFVTNLTFSEKNQMWDHFFKNSSPIPDVPADVLDRIYNAPGYYSYGVLLKTVSLTITNYQGNAYTEAEEAVAMRFGKVFEQTYIRFKDLEQAEEQAREGQIQLALERVRARTMAMQKSEELAETASVLFQQLLNLGIRSERTIIGIPKDDTGKIEFWGTEQGGNQINTRFEYEANATYAFREIYKAWQEKRNELTVILKGKNLDEHVNYVRNVLHVPLLAGLVQKQRMLYNAFFSKGWLEIVTPDTQSKETLDILQRFAGVFDGTYTRFLDLQKAEAQAREAQIELALERVRARTMAMQKSEELAETAAVLFQQLLNLGISSERTFIGMPNDDTRKIELWGTEQGGNQMSMRFEYEADATYAFREIYKAWQEKRSEFTVILKGKNLDEHVNYVRNVLHMPILVGLVQQQRILYNAFFSKGLLMIVTPDTQSTETLEILQRFAGVFDGTYTRFLDLQRAEEQAREAKIETALERVRAVAMSMMRSDELVGVCESIYIQLNELGFTNIRDAQIYIRYDEQREFMNYSFSDYHGAEVVKVGYDSHPRTRRLFDAIENSGEAIIAHDIVGEELKNWKAYLTNSIKQKLDKKLQKATELHYYLYSIGSGALGVSMFRSINDEELNILKRFRNVFNLSYQRYTDIARAEEQAREAKIETALERVRSKTMAMHNSQDVSETVAVMFDELVKLGVETTSRLGICIVDNTSHIEVWAASADAQGKTSMRIGRVDMTIHPILQALHAAWKNKETMFSYLLAGEDMKAYYRALNNSPDYPSQFNLDNLPKRQEHHSFIFPEGAIFIFSLQPLTTEITQIFKKFAGVFGQTYRRYLDLQKAEKQAREAQIEAALERVRSKAMAMRNSNDLLTAASTVFTELQNLGIKQIRSGVGLIAKDFHTAKVYSATSSQKAVDLSLMGEVTLYGHPVFEQQYQSWLKRENYFVTLEGKELASYYKILSAGLNADLGVAVKKNQKEYGHWFMFAEGFLYAWSDKEYTDAEITILERFKNVIALTVRRYIELQKAELQAREAQIEGSLERVRSKTMAMHNSHDVGDTIAAMFSEFVKLGIETIRCGILIGDGTNEMEVWTAKSNPDGVATLIIGRLDITIHPLLQGVYSAWKNKESIFEYRMTGDDLKDYYRAINNSNYYPVQFDIDSLPAKQVHTDFFFADGAVFAFTAEPIADSAVQIFKRFAGVFGQTYRRYLDLQKAETQAREAQIEASLERVRGKALAMYNSKDLSSTASLVFTELRKLGVNSKRCGVALLSKNSRHTQLYVATTTLDTDSLDLVGAIELSGHPSLEKQYESWLKHEDYFTVLKGQELKSYKELIYSMLPVPYDHSYHEEFGYYLAFSEGFLFSWAEKPFSEIEINILNRFKSIIDLTFRRYIELQKSEANARDAVRQSSLDRVRAEIASMRTTGDLDRITPLIWNELTTLGVPFIRCGVFIMDEQQQQIHTYLSTPDGKAIAAFQLHFYADTGNGVNGVALRGWREKQAVTLHWTEEEFRKFSHSLVEQGEITSEAGYLTEHPPAGLDLHFFPFLQGMLYAGNTEPLTEDEKDLVQSLADAFSTAYARFEDFNRLELAKLQVENTLSDLKLAQTKLVQSEKMASLGELTAGIAHEIQNPLNFVNNFSEVNQEMIEELEEELNAGNIEEALAIIADIKQNEEKINHHGKRADGIVKGMLEHSRTGGGEKQPININALADEFMRLSYHGLRAKDKVFNAEMVTNFDPDLPKINVVGQDIGRVILNLFNNAFYAVNQKKKTAAPDYRPEVSVTTSAENGRVSVTVKDNGTGIPDAIKEKIMQPFFTTKPTGEGTGLGLSLTYDMVVKGHGGSIQVNSVEGEGSEFIIQLPIS